MNCPNCKQPLADGRKFCTNCGCPTDASDFFDADALGIGFTDVLTEKYFCFRGRARRKEYWMFILFTSIIGFVLQILIPFIFAPVFGKFVFFIFRCGFGIPEAALTVRRFQDTGKKRWLALLLFGTSWLFGMIALFGGTDGAYLICGVFAIPMLIIVCFDSQPGPNKYGPNPKGR
jgi:uncharacterized membrane protein YhaH (DUF805 family)